MKKYAFKNRFLFPVLAVWAVMTASWGIYNVAWRLDNHLIHHVLAAVFGTSLFLSVTFGTLVVYPITYFRGASLIERVTASLINPALWAIKECFRLMISFTVPESLYYFFNPLSLWLFCGVWAQIGLAEILCRKRLKQQGEEITVLHPAAVILFSVSLFLVIFLYAWGQGENIYVIFLEGFRKLFGPGIGVPLSE